MGIVRRIDELGRIVIPKEIRDILNINNGDELEIITENNDILLRKYSRLSNEKEKYDQIMESLNPLVDGLLLLTDNDRIISKGSYENETISFDIKSIIRERKPYQSSFIEKYQLGNNTLQGYFYIFPILHNSVIKGSIIIVKSIPITQEDKMFINVLKNIIDNF